MYPKVYSDIDDYKVPSDVVFETKPQIQKMVQKENKCKQFFPKSKKLTKEFLDKVHISKLAKTDTYVFVDEWRSSILTISVICALVVLFLFSFFGIFFMWYTNGFNGIIYSRMVLSEGSLSFDLWSQPRPKPLVNVYLFNYTNVDRYENGIDAKLNVEEKGPYVYEQTIERTNIEHNGTHISYQPKWSYKFLPELSKGRQSDIVVVPNMLLLSAAAINRHSNFFTRLTISSTLNTGVYSKPFVTLAADRFIIGYDDQLYSLSKSVMNLQGKTLAEKLGLLSQKIGVSPDVYTVHTGLNDIDQISTIKSLNGKDEMEIWSTKECNKIEGSEGSMFSPIAVSQKKPVKIFMKEICRSLDLVYEKENIIFDGDIPSYKYVIPEDYLDSPETCPKNQCFCDLDGGTCPMQGLFNTTLCSMGVPTFFSYPHFYRADPRVAQGVTGLNPNKSVHESYIDLHPVMGFPMNGKSRMQANIQILKTFGFSQLDKYENELIIPLAWFDMTVEDNRLPQEMKDYISTVTHTVAMIENLLKYGSIILALVTIVPIVANIRHKMRGNRRTDSIRPLQKEETNC